MTINNLYDPFFGPSTLRFHDSASSDSATNNNSSHASSPIRISALSPFFDHSDAATARFETASGGIVDFSGSNGLNSNGRIKAGSIAGAGTYYIGAGNTLSVGGNNLSTEVNGVIADFNPCGCG